MTLSDLNRKATPIGILVLAIILVGVWRLNAHRPRASGDIPSYVSPSLREAHLSREEQWALATQKPMRDSGADGGALANQESIRDSDAGGLLRELWDTNIRDPDQLLTPSQREKLLATLEMHSAARSADTAADFIKLADKESALYAWTTDEETFRSNHVYGAYEGRFDRPPSIHSVDDTKTTLSELWAKSAEFMDHRFQTVGVGQGGANIVIHRVYTPDYDEHGIGSVEENQYWESPPMHLSAIHFRQPTISLTEYFRTHRSALVASVHILVRNEMGVTFNWQSEWLLNSDGQWICEYMGAATGRSLFLFF